VRVYLDVEGVPDTGHFYLIGLLVAEGDTCRRLSLWADGAADEPLIWGSFLRAVEQYGEEFVLFHYGSYESEFLRRMAQRHGGDPALLGRIASRSVNVLSLATGASSSPRTATTSKASPAAWATAGRRRSPPGCSPSPGGTPGRRRGTRPSSSGCLPTTRRTAKRSSG
jgi:hypothetical protein